MSIHEQYLGLGLWRTSPNRICALSRGGAWIYSVVSTRPPDIEEVDRIEGAVETVGTVEVAGAGAGEGVVKVGEEVRSHILTLLTLT